MNDWRQDLEVCNRFSGCSQLDRLGDMLGSDHARIRQVSDCARHSTDADMGPRAESEPNDRPPEQLLSALFQSAMDFQSLSIKLCIGMAVPVLPHPIPLDFTSTSHSVVNACRCLGLVESEQTVSRHARDLDA